MLATNEMKRRIMNHKKTNGEDIQLSKKVRVTDPCYNSEVWCAGVLDNVLPGTYKTHMTEFANGADIRVGLLSIWHESVTNSDSLIEKHEKADISVGVDSGRAGFIDESFYQSLLNNKDSDDDDWDDELELSKVCKVPLTEDEITLCENFFLVSNYCRLAEQQGRVLSEEEINEWTSKSNIIRDLLEHKYGISFPNQALDTKTKNVHENIIATPGQKGAFTFSGYGDGMYDCYICKNDYGQIVGLMLDFLNVLK